MISRSLGVAAGLLFACTSPSSSDAPSGEPGPVVETGIASFYSDALAGRPTASGEPYDPSQGTCAHRKLPLGTVVQVERAKTGETATCRINDRGPYHDDRIIDLSRSVAEALEIEGIAKVKLRIVEPAAASE
jgi:rare lipoprotein A